MATIVDIAEFSSSRYARRFDRGGLRGEVVLFTGVQYQREPAGFADEDADALAPDRECYDSGYRFAADLDEPPAAG